MCFKLKITLNAPNQFTAIFYSHIDIRKGNSAKFVLQLTE